MPCTRHRVFLATLIVTAKYLNDSSPKNVHWSNYAVLFDVAEINLMEKQLLYLLDYELRFTEQELCEHFAPFLVPTSLETSLSARSSAVSKVARAGKARAEAQQQSIPMLPTPADEKEPQYPAPAHLAASSATDSSSLPTSASSGSATAAITSAVRGIARRLSAAHLRQGNAPAPAHVNISSDSTASASTSASDLASLTDDTGSSSSSSGWASNNDSDADDEHDALISIVEPSSSSSSLAKSFGNAVLAGPGTMKKPFSLRPVPVQAYKTPNGARDITPTRARKLSDTSSINTVMASPSVSRKAQFQGSRIASNSSMKRALPASVSIQLPISGSQKKTEQVSLLSASSTVPALPALTGSLSRTGLRQRTGAATASQQSEQYQGTYSSCNTSSSGFSSLSASTISTASSGPSPLKSTTPTRGVGAIISRMWGAAAANLKAGVSHSSSSNTLGVSSQDVLSASETRPLISSTESRGAVA
ncbi:hypothetical protein D9619_001194 [Psilocybe cf. subviscida]|uniref:Cyclin N-terminal domain-containing protein n=1 Tax=Psilocybe cf. subviscida TaxID=2480587 RepID=A0A8H5F1X8_9AGAR|nr:hypothetical protein D9619_001194 [Psilocybe cf. subviscida]